MANGTEHRSVEPTELDQRLARVGAESAVEVERLTAELVERFGHEGVRSALRGIDDIYLETIRGKGEELDCLLGFFPQDRANKERQWPILVDTVSRFLGENGGRMSRDRLIQLASAYHGISPEGMAFLINDLVYKESGFSIIEDDIVLKP